MIGHLFGPISCRRHDSYLLNRSELHRKLSDVLQAFPVDYLCYGDAAYPALRFITKGVKGAAADNLNKKPEWMK